MACVWVWMDAAHAGSEPSHATVAGAQPRVATHAGTPSRFLPRPDALELHAEALARPAPGQPREIEAYAVAQALAERAGLTLKVWRGQGLTPTVTLPPGRTVAEALDILTADVNLAWNITDGDLWIGPAAELLRPHTVVQVIDVRLLTQAVPAAEAVDLTQPGTTALPGGGGGGNLFAATRPRAVDTAGFDDSSLSTLVETALMVDPAFDLPWVWLSIHRGVLTVRHVPEVVDEVALLVDELEASYGRMVGTRVEAFAVPAGTYAEWAEGRGVPIVTAEDAAALRDTLTAAGTRVAAAQQVGYNGQRVALSAVAERVRLTDGTVIPDAPSIDPSSETLERGLAATVLPIVNADGGAVALHLSLDLTAGGAESEATSPAADGQLTFSLAENDTLRLRTSVQVPSGGAAVFMSHSNAMTHLGADTELIVIVSATADAE